MEERDCLLRGEQIPESQRGVTVAGLDFLDRQSEVQHELIQIDEDADENAMFSDLVHD